MNKISFQTNSFICYNKIHITYVWIHSLFFLLLSSSIVWMNVPQFGYSHIKDYLGTLVVSSLGQLCIDKLVCYKSFLRTCFLLSMLNTLEHNHMITSLTLGESDKLFSNLCYLLPQKPCMRTSVALHTPQHLVYSYFDWFPCG
jgi:hypothetical protein